MNVQDKVETLSPDEKLEMAKELFEEAKQLKAAAQQLTEVRFVIPSIFMAILKTGDLISWFSEHGYCLSFWVATDMFCCVPNV